MTKPNARINPIKVRRIGAGYAWDYAVTLADGRHYRATLDGAGRWRIRYSRRSWYGESIMSLQTHGRLGVTIIRACRRYDQNCPNMPAERKPVLPVEGSEIA